MRKYWIFTCFFIISCLLLWNIGMAQENQGPQIVIQESTFDFNEVKEGKVLEHIFSVSNQGDMPLKITKVRPG